MGWFTSFSEGISAPKLRARGNKFFDHFSQATLFWNSQSDPEDNTSSKHSASNWERLNHSRSGANERPVERG
ncbi:MAG TPA: hypothetical protein VGR15_07255 [Bacteroidota bacterium]|nr:hypothetical protein [Bacteroidota bacterium]